MRSMRRALLFPLVAVAFISTVWAAAPEVQWTLPVGGQEGESGWWVEVTSDGNFIASGTTTSFGAGAIDAYLVRADMWGDTLWTKTLGGSANDAGLSVAEMAGGGYLVAGYSASFGAGDEDAYLVRTDAAGDSVWMRRYGGTEIDLFYCARQTSLGSIVACGYTYSTVPYDTADAYAVMTTSDGYLKWERVYGGGGDDRLAEIIETGDGGFAMVGFSRYVPPTDTCQIYVVRINAGGDTLWTRRYGGPGMDYGSGIRETPDGGFMVLGTTYSYGAGGSDIYLVRTDADGDTLWTRTYGGPGDEWGYDLIQTPDMGYAIGGRTSSYGAGMQDFYVVKIQADGDIIWTQTHGGPANDLGLSIRETGDHGFIMCGYTASYGSGRDDLYLVKFKPDAAGIGGLPQDDGVRLELAGTNPFKHEVGITFGCRGSEVARVSVYSVSGKEVARLFKGSVSGRRTAQWDGCDAAGRDVSPGVYFVRFATRSGSVAKKVVLMR
jgi:hypothetical protein